MCSLVPTTPHEGKHLVITHYFHRQLKCLPHYPCPWIYNTALQLLAPIHSLLTLCAQVTLSHLTPYSTVSTTFESRYLNKFQWKTKLMKVQDREQYMSIRFIPEASTYEGWWQRRNMTGPYIVRKLLTWHHHSEGIPWMLFRGRTDGRTYLRK